VRPRSSTGWRSSGAPRAWAAWRACAACRS
jgi:hypothetical protein